MTARLTPLRLTLLLCLWAILVAVILSLAILEWPAPSATPRRTRPPAGTAR